MSFVPPAARIVAFLGFGHTAFMSVRRIAAESQDLRAPSCLFLVLSVITVKEHAQRFRNVYRPSDGTYGSANTCCCVVF